MAVLWKTFFRQIWYTLPALACAAGTFHLKPMLLYIEVMSPPAAITPCTVYTHARPHNVLHSSSYRGISLLSVPDKVLALILLERLQAIIYPQLMEAQCGFRRGRGTTPVFQCFVDLTKGCDSVNC